MAIIPQSSLSGPLAPKFNLHEDTRKATNRPFTARKNGTNYIPLGVFILFSLFAIPLTLGQLKSEQDIRQRAAEPFPTQVIPSPTPFPSPTPTILPTATPGIR